MDLDIAALATPRRNACVYVNATYSADCQNHTAWLGAYEVQQTCGSDFKILPIQMKALENYFTRAAYPETSIVIVRERDGRVLRVERFNPGGDVRSLSTRQLGTVTHHCGATDVREEIGRAHV